MPRRRNNKKRNGDPNISPSKRLNNEKIRGIIEAQFSKAFEFKRPSNDGDSTWILPEAQHILEPHDKLLWNVFDSITTLKNELNSVKDELSDIDIVEWHDHTTKLNIASKVVPHVRFTASVQLCTQAWCKFYEILCKFKVVPGADSNLKTLNSVHLCEAPGAFITSLNHYMALTRDKMKLSWLATTFNPYYEGNQVGQAIPDDRFIKTTLEHWDFGPDNTGDILTSSSRASILKRAQSMEPIHLVTADGSIDCQNDPSEQETMVAKLQLTEVVTALRILSSKGSLVVKMFTCFEPASICLMYLLNCTFSEVFVCKPGTSKRGNSEVYVICLDYKGNSMFESQLSKIEAHLEQPIAPLFTPNILPKTFMKQMTECCRYFQIHQVEAIREHLRLFKNMTQEEEVEIEKAKSMTCSEFLKKFCVTPIDSNKEIVKNCQALKQPTKVIRPLRFGSLNQRKTKANSNWHEGLSNLDASMTKKADQILSDLRIKPDGEVIVPRNPMELEINATFGKVFHRCWNSHFCNRTLMSNWDDVCDRFEKSRNPYPKFEELDSNEDLSDGIIDVLMKFQTVKRGLFIPQNESCQALVTNLVKHWPYKESTDPITTILVDDLRYQDSWNVCYTSEATLLYLSRFCDVVERCNKDDWLIIAISPLLTRVDVGLMRILNCAFEKIILLSRLKKGQPSGVAVCCTYSNPIAPSLLEKLRKLGKDEDAILEILHISIIFEKEFRDLINMFNSKAVAERRKYLLKYLITEYPKKAKKNEKVSRLEIE